MLAAFKLSAVPVNVNWRYQLSEVSATGGPAAVDREAVRLASEFGGAAQADLRWRPWARKTISAQSSASPQLSDTPFRAPIDRG